jgi:N-acetylmuramic acid 6-phosphate (MurNAc-6-P) etherase
MVNMIPNNIKLRKRAVSMVMDILEMDEVEAQKLLEENDWNIKQAIKTKIK